jgi:PPOX class probable F420-dependent enzyme
MAEFPANYLDLATTKIAFAALATLMPDGTPQVTPVWFDYTDGMIRAQNMQEGAAVALSIVDPDNAYRYVQVRGRVTRTTTDGAANHIEALSHKYMGKPYPFWSPGQERVLCEVSIDHASASG